MAVQELIKNYWKTHFNKTELYQEIIREFFNLEKVYILVSSKFSHKDIANNEWKPYISEDGGGELTIRVFSEEKIAKETGNKYLLVKDKKTLIAPMTIPDLMTMIRSLMNNGIESIIIDDGANFFRENTSKLLKSYYESIGEPQLYEGETFEVISILNTIWRKDCDVLIIPRPDTTIVNVMDKQVKPVIEEVDEKRVMNVFLLKSDAEKYGNHKGYVSQSGTPYNMEINRFYLYNMLLDLSDDIDEVNIDRFGKCNKISMKLLLQIMKDIGFISCR